MAVMPIPDDWDGETWQCWAIKWPSSESWNGILRGFVTTPLKGRFWDERTGTVSDAQFVGQEIWDNNSPMEECLMACNETSTGILEGILEALQDLVNKPCCPSGTGGGSRGSGILQEPFNEYDQSATPTVPPSGFSTMPEFDAHKCNAANDIINALGSDLQGIAGISYAASPPTGILGILIGILLTPIPFDDLIALIGYMTYTSIQYSFLVEFSAVISDNQSDLLCTLYSSSDSQTAQTDFRQALNDLIDAQSWVTNEKAFVSGAIDYLTPSDAFNNMFTNQPTSSTDSDCSGCASGGFPITCWAGTKIPMSSTVLQIAGGPVSSDYLASWGWDGVGTFTFTIVDGSFSPPNVVPEFANSTDDAPDVCGSGNGYPWDNIDDDFTYITLTTPGTWQLRSGSTFTVEIERTS